MTDNQSITVICHFYKGDPVGIRTRDPQLRRLLLYPAELPDHHLYYWIIILFSAYFLKANAKLDFFPRFPKFQWLHLTYINKSSGDIWELWIYMQFYLLKWIKWFFLSSILFWGIIENYPDESYWLDCQCQKFIIILGRKMRLEMGRKGQWRNHGKY